MNHLSKHTEIEYLNEVQKNKKANNSLSKFEKGRKIEDTLIKDVRNLFRLKKKQPKK